MRHRSRAARIIALVTLAAGLGLATAYAALPGYHRALTPGWFGLTPIGDGLWIDDPAEAPRARALVASSTAPTQSFFGPLQSDPRFLLCTTQACADTFGLGPMAVTLGYHIIIVGPRGLTPMIVAHERLHAELHRSMGLGDLVSPRFPAWFDEGLASHLSGDDRLNRPDDPRAADWIKRAETFRDWSRLHPDQNWRDTYGAAARLVQEIDATAGRTALQSLVARVAAGADFEREHARLSP